MIKYLNNRGAQITARNYEFLPFNQNIRRRRAGGFQASTFF